MNHKQAKKNSDSPRNTRTQKRGTTLRSLTALLPGLGLAALAVALSFGVAVLLPTVSVLLTTIVLGVLARNLLPLPAAVEPGLNFSAKRLLRAGIVLLGLQLVVGDILGLGVGMVVTVIAIVVVGMLGAILVGHWLGMSPSQTILIACGFSICGAAAVAAAEGVIDTKDDEEVVTAIALVVVFGTLMIPLVPLAASVLLLDNEHAGLWAGGSIHEVAQVVAAGGIIGGSALGLAVIVKLGRVLMLAPVMAGLGIMRRISLQREPARRRTTLPPIIPLFVAGFIVMVVVRSLGWMPAAALPAAQLIQTALLGAAMFALGTGVRFAAFKNVGARPFVLATIVTVLVAVTAYVGVTLFA